MGIAMRLKQWQKSAAAVAVLAAGAVFIVVGVLRGEAADVLRKAANICLECIGIG